MVLALVKFNQGEYHFSIGLSLSHSLTNAYDSPAVQLSILWCYTAFITELSGIYVEYEGIKDFANRIN